MRGQLRREEVLSLVRHFDDCARCRDAAAASEQVVHSAAALEADLLAGATEEEPPAARGVRPVLRWPLAAAAAAAFAVIGVSAYIARQPPSLPRVQQQPVRPVVRVSPPVVPRAATYERPGWNTAVADAVRAGGIPLPAALAELQLSADPERAPGQRDAPWLTPAATIVETTRPEFRWAPVRGATYVVSVFEEQSLVAESAALHDATWIPNRDLRRGRVYHWQVEVRGRDGESNILPAPPAPPAFFRVLDAASHEELTLARAAHENDPLLLGVLYAGKGLRAEAEQELARVDTAEGRRLLKSVQAWPRAGNRR